MTIHLYKDSALAQQISEGNLSNPDSDTYDGEAGESKDKQLYVANEQTTLSAAISTSSTTIALSAARFQNGDTIIIDSEQMLITAGGGTTSLTVTRAVSGTTAAAHSSGVKVYTARTYTGLTVQPADTQGTNEAAWLILATTQAGLGTGTPGAALTLGAKTHSQTLSFWRRVTVPAGTPVQNKTDIKLRLTGTESQV